MDINAAFPSKYLKAHDLDGREIRLAIQRVEMENIGDDDRKPVLYFTKAKKGLVLNKTNSNVVKSAYGKETDQWIGKEVILFSMMVQFRDELVEGIRLKIPKPPKMPEASMPVPPHPSENPADGFGDDVPFEL